MLSASDITRLKELIDGSRPPESGIERHFLRVICGNALPCSPQEVEWHAYWQSVEITTADSHNRPIAKTTTGSPTEPQFDRFFVGRDRDGTYVRDLQIQPQFADLCILWCVETELFEIYRTTMVERYVKPLADSTDNIVIVKAYEAWYSKNGNQWFKSQRDSLIASIESDDPAEKHKRFIRALGIEDPGRNQVTRSHRETHCYNCGTPIDSSVDLECRACGWIICGDCGACGCGYSR